MSSDAIASKNKTDVISKVNMSKNNETSKTNTHRVTKTIVSSPNVYKPVGPYSQAVLAGKTLYVSGVLGMDLQAQLVCGGAEAQTKQALENLKHILEAGGASLDSVVKTTILLNNLNDFQVVNQVYAEYKSIQFEEDAEETYSKHVEVIDTWSETRTEMKMNELPPSGSTESVPFVRNNKSASRLEPEKDLDTSEHTMLERESSDTRKTSKDDEDEGRDEKISKLKLEVVEKFIGASQDTNHDKDIRHVTRD